MLSRIQLLEQESHVITPILFLQLGQFFGQEEQLLLFESKYVPTGHETH
jgi:hypothetical protein